ncbi:AsnC family transcriptional regulator [Sulfolobus acidocaldarius DSM 639]|uniref:AsnC family transcriptional regulator n=4 Tax=Sulfolobus acidocaldarius TaxID=2285 RepID=Q4JA27_SULAC|nr:AsnC family transcriptional regulator [Sulfolobus acidocaldarius DSM 639]
MRIRRLKEKGVIKGFYVDISPEAIGLNVVAFIMIKADPKRYEQILKKIASFKSIFEVFDITGEYYSILKVRVKSREELAKILDEIGNMEGVTSTYTMFVLRTIKEAKTIDFD